MIKNVIFAVAFIFYSFTVGYYTSYGVYKSVSEYWCTYKGPGTLDYRDDFLTGALRLLDGPATHYQGEKLLTCYNSTVQWIGSGELHDSGNSFSSSYKTDVGYFNLKCERYSFGYNNQSAKVEDGVLKVTEEDLIHRNGYRISGGWNKTFHVMKNETGGSSDFFCESLLCTLTKSTETCDLPLKETNKFVKIYLVMSSIFALLVFIVFLPFKERLVLRFFVICRTKIAEYFSNEIKFCNPVDGLPRKIKKGCLINKMCDDQLNHVDGPKVDTFEDVKGIYKFVSSNEVMIILKTKKNRIVKLNDKAASVLKNYWVQISLNADMCVTNDNENHYLSTEEVIEELSRGRIIKTFSKRTECCTNEYTFFEYGFLKGNYNLIDEQIKFLLTHNEKFFGSINLCSIRNCLNGKTNFNHRPKGVKNSQWKVYTSDLRKFCHEKLNKQLWCQKNYQKSEAYLETESIKFETVSSPKDSKPESYALIVAESIGENCFTSSDIFERRKICNAANETNHLKYIMPESVEIAQSINTFANVLSKCKPKNKKAASLSIKEKVDLVNEILSKVVIKDDALTEMAKARISPKDLDEIDRLEANIEGGRSYKKRKDLDNAKIKLENLKQNKKGLEQMLIQNKIISSEVEKMAIDINFSIKNFELVEKYEEEIEEEKMKLSNLLAKEGVNYLDGYVKTNGKRKLVVNTHNLNFDTENLRHHEIYRMNEKDLADRMLNSKTIKLGKSKGSKKKKNCDGVKSLMRKKTKNSKYPKECFIHGDLKKTLNNFVQQSRLENNGVDCTSNIRPKYKRLILETLKGKKHGEAVSFENEVSCRIANELQGAMSGDITRERALRFGLNFDKLRVFCKL